MDNNFKRVILSVVCLMFLGLTRASELTNASYVDLGLPSGTLWANMNLGASSITDYGDFFCWGETSPKETYTATNYKWYNRWDVEAHTYIDEDGFTVNVEASTNWGFSKYCGDSKYGFKGFTDNLQSLELEDDAAYIQWGKNWRMPTRAELWELIEKCTWTWVSLDGINGYKVTGINGNFIFIPAAGYREDENIYYTYGPIFQRGATGIYLTKDADSWPQYAKSMYFFKDKVDMGSTLFNGQFNGYRMHGLSVRPVYVGTPLEKCKTPTIYFINGKLCFESDTPNCKFIVSIKCPDSQITSTISELDLSGIYNIEVYATSEGYEKSDIATANLIWNNCEVTSSSVSERFINPMPVLITTTPSDIIIKGNIEGERIQIFDLSGQIIYNDSISENIKIIPKESNKGIYIVKIGDNSGVKIVM